MAKGLDKRTPVVKAMAEAWDVIAPLMCGTNGMRKARETLLPKWPQETPEAYDMRVATSTLFPAYDRTVQTLTGKPFSKPIAIGDDVPAKIKGWLDDCDLQGRNLDTFGSNTMEIMVGYGLGGILVECPQRPEGVRTQADEESIGLRPYFIQIRPQQIVGWRAAYTPAQGWRLTQLRLEEEVEVEDGEFDVKCIKQVRLLTPGAWSTWRKTDETSDEWHIDKEGTTSLSYIPFVPTYGKRIGFMQGEPPLLELAHMNIKHWQSQSDQDTLTHVARVPILVATGVDDKNLEIVIGASNCVKLTEPDSDLKYVEHTGKAIESGLESLKELKDEMRQAGAELLVIGQRVQVTATQVASENELGTCAMQRISQGLEDALDMALQMMADYAKLGDGGSVTLFNDFGIDALSDASAELVFKMAASNKLSDQTLHSEMQRRNILSPDVEWEDEQARLEAQGPPPGTEGLDAQGNPLPPQPQPPAQQQPVPPLQ